MADSCAQYVSADDLKAAKESILHIEHVATSKDANGNPALVVTDPIRGVGYTNATLDGLFSDIGFKPVNGSFEDGGTLVNRWDVLLYETNGSFYQWVGAIPVGGLVVSAGSSPFDSGGNLLPGWADQTDLTLRTTLTSTAGADFVIAADGSSVQDNLDYLKPIVTDLHSRDNGNIADDDSLVTSSMFTSMRSAENHQHYLVGTTIPRNLSIPYDHFGLTFKNRRGQVLNFFRRGPTHVNSLGVIMKTQVNSVGQWSTPVEITAMTDSVLDARVATGGVMPDGSIVIAVNYMNPTTSIFDDVKFYKSEDDGDTWTLLQVIDVNQTSGYSYNIPFGPVVMLDTTAVIARYKRVGTNFSVGYFYSNDGGNTWAEKDVYTDTSGTNDFNESGICSIGRLAFMVSRIGSGITGKFRLFRSTDGGSTWSDLGDSNFTGGDGAYVVAPSLNVLRNSNGTPFVILQYVDRTAQVMYYRTALVSDLISGVYTFSERKRITGGLTNSSGYQSGFFEGHRFIGVVYQEITAQTAAQGISVEFSVVDVPEYDSGWFAVSANTNYSQAVPGNSQIFQKIEVLFSPDTAAGTVYKVDAHSNTSGGTTYGIGASIQASSGNITVKTGSRVFGNTLFGTSSTEYTTGYYRILAWL